VRTRKDLRGYQARIIPRAVKERTLGLFVDMSLGKTVISLTVLKTLLERNKVLRGALVVAPIVVTKETWQNEAKKWSHLKNLKFVLVDGKRPALRIKQLQEHADVHVISYTMLPWLGRILDPRYWKRNQRPPWMPEMLILDESENIKGRGAWFKVLRYKVLKWTPYRIIQTGTPAAHSLFDLWPQMFVLDKGRRLGSAFDRYRSRFFQQADYNGFAFTPREGAEKLIYDLIGDKVIRLDGDDWLELPQVVEEDVYVDLPARAMKLYRKHENDMFTKLDNMKEVEAANAAVLSGQCWQLANGAIYDDPEERDSWTEIHTVKLEALRREIDQAVGQPVIVPYWFRHDRARLEREYPKATFLNKNNVVEVRPLWAKGKIPILFLNPQSVSHGLNDFELGGHIIIWFAQIWSGGKYHQIIARLKRPDQRAPHVISRCITARNTVDEVISDSRNRRLRGQAALFEALKAYRMRKNT